MRVALLSDTHSHLDLSFFNLITEMDEIWHAGDIGDQTVLKKLQEWKPVRAVFGNIDSPAIRHTLPEVLRIDVDGLKILMTHIGGTPPRYNPHVRKLLKDEPADVLICGHSHILKVMKDPNYNNMLYINPGAAGNHGFHRIKTFIRFEISDKAVRKLEVIELGKRGEVKDDQ